jgi:hypothetical protein
METDWPFERVLDLLTSHGYEMIYVERPNRVFKKPGRLPIIVPVIDRKVDIEYVERIKQWLEREEREDGP